MSVCYYFLNLLRDYDFYKPMAKSTRKGKFRPHSCETAWSILMTFEP